MIINKLKSYLGGKTQISPELRHEPEENKDRSSNGKNKNAAKLIGFVFFIICCVFIEKPDFIEQVIGEEIFGFAKSVVQSVLNILFGTLNQKHIPDFFETSHLRFYAVYFAFVTTGLLTQLTLLAWFIPKTLKDRDSRNRKDLLKIIFSIAFLIFCLFIAILNLNK